MIIRKHLHPFIIARLGWKRVLTLTVLSSLVYLAYGRFGNKELAISTLPASILGIAIAFLIAFRVNAAYERWWEGRQVWGRLVNDSRTFARQAGTFIPREAQKKPSQGARVVLRELTDGQIGFVYALNNSLRGRDVIESVRAYFPPEALSRIEVQRNIPNAILQLQAMRLAAAFGENCGNMAHTELSRTLDRLCDSMGSAERIKSTVFPRQYGYYATVFTMMYSYLLPFILVQECGWLVIPFTVLIGFIFFSLDNIAGQIENPFSNTFNDTPMDFLCRTIEINLRQMNGDAECPEPIEPVNGFLM